MEFTFYKYQGTGNDFIIIDNRLKVFPKNNTNLVSTLCDRRFGIGADGLVLLEDNDEVDFTMVYYNADGNLSTMCGNGGRCIVNFADYLGVIEKSAVFEAVDGLHQAVIDNGIVSLKMKDVSKVTIDKDYVFVDTGSPHHVQFVEKLDSFNVKLEGSRIRNEKYGKEGANINFISKIDTENFDVRTYERGVEDETLSCGTGVTAVALAMAATGNTDKDLVNLHTLGGKLSVSFTKSGDGFANIFLEGPAKLVFQGTYKGVW